MSGQEMLTGPSPQTRALTGAPRGGPPSLGPARAGSAAGTTTLSRADRPVSCGAAGQGCVGLRSVAIQGLCGQHLT